MQRGNVTPDEAVNSLVYLTGLYSYLSAQLTDLEAARPGIWLKMRDDTTTDKRADIIWDAGEMGQKMTRLKGELKRVDALIKTLKIVRRHLSDEWNNTPNYG